MLPVVACDDGFLVKERPQLARGIATGEAPMLGEQGLDEAGDETGRVALLFIVRPRVGDEEIELIGVGGHDWKETARTGEDAEGTVKVEMRPDQCAEVEGPAIPGKKRVPSHPLANPRPKGHRDAADERTLYILIPEKSPFVTHKMRLT